MQWLRDEIGLIRSAEDTHELALSVDGTHGVYFVPHSWAWVLPIGARKRGAQL